MNNDTTLTANREYKSSIFEMVFSEKENLLELYNAINGTNYDDPDLLEINTLKNAIYMSMHNDVSFIIDSQLSLYEHQSTVNPNLPLRYLMYVSDLYSSLTINENLYGTKAIKLPTPKFIIFYNGDKKQPDSQILKLSDMYKIPITNPELELQALMLNINPGHNQTLLNACKTLSDYSTFTSKVRSYASTMNTNQAVELAINECIKNDILADFLLKNKAEAIKMSIYEYDAEKHIRMEREDAKADGIMEERVRSIKSLMDSLSMSAEQAMAALKILPEEYSEYLSLLKIDSKS